MEKQYFYNTPSARMLEFDRIIGCLEEMAYTEKAKEMNVKIAKNYLMYSKWYEQDAEETNPSADIL